MLQMLHVFPQMTVSVPASKPSSRGRKSVPGTPALRETRASAKEDRLNPGLPQLNKSRKADFKKMKKQRKRRGGQTFFFI